MSSHEQYMARAIHLAERGLYTTDPNPRVGCVLVKHDRIIGEGWHARAGEGHAEVNALREAGAEAKGADCYVTLEPCSHFGRTPPCADALINADVKRVFIAMTDPNPIVSGAGISRLRAAGIEVFTHILSAQAEQLNPGFCMRMRQHRPFIRSKVAMSLDGRTAMASGESKWITGHDARTDVQKWRARSSAILTGIATVLADDPQMNVRLGLDTDWYPQSNTIRQPLNVIVDSQLRTPVNAKILQQKKRLIATAVDINHPADVETVVIPNTQMQVDLTALMAVLAQRDINEVLVEAGTVLNGALLTAGLIDELIIYVAPKLMGDSAKGIFHLPQLQTMSEAVDLDITDIRAVGGDWRITAVPKIK